MDVPHSPKAMSDLGSGVISWTGRVHHVVTTARGWKRAGIAALAGLVSVLAMAPFHIWPVLFVTMPVLVWLIEPLTGEVQSARAPLIRAFKNGWWFGFGYFFAGLFWVGEAFLVEADTFGWLLPFAVTLLPAGLALFYGAAAAFTHAIWRPGLAGLLLMAVVFAGAEWLRGHLFTGFPWNVLGYAITQPLVLMQSASVIGIYGLTLWVVLIFAAPLVLAVEQRTTWPGLAIAIISLMAFSAFGALYSNGTDGASLDGPRVRIVQPSVLQREKWLPEKQAEIFQLHLDLSRQNAKGERDGMTGITHVIWPEAAMPFKPLEQPRALEEIGKLLPAGAHLVSGGLRVETAPGPNGEARKRAYNSLMVFGAGGSLAAIYDKIHLVPFGEYLPYQSVLERIGLQQLTRQRGGFATGQTPRPLISLPGLPPIAGLICYEAIFPTAVVQSSERPGLLINITNDGWFGNTTGPRQHLHQTRVRAVEEGLPVLRAANNGISAVIDGNGRLLQSLGMNERGVIDSVIPRARPATLYAQFGDWMFLANVLAFFFVVAVIGRWQID